MTEDARPETARTPEEIRQWLLTRVAARVGADPRILDPRERFSRYGLDSMKAAGVTAELSEFLGRPLPRTLVWDNPSIDALVRYLTTSPAAAAAGAPAVDAAVAARTGEPIAIVGLACRFPQAPNPDAYWRLLIEGIDAIREVPAERWDLSRYFDEDITVPGRMSTRWGAFVDGVDRFDPQFFGISPREAEQMDPQQRLVMELAWEAFEDAGVNVDGLKDSRTGVYVGAMWSDYARLVAGTPEAITQHTATGQDTSITAARVSYTFGLRGPSIAVNTACSSSLVAVHLACEAIRSGEASLALAGGVSLVLSPESTVAMSKFGAMAPDGRSKAFDARANGYVRGEGAGLVVLKPLSRAVADGDRIYCVILAEGINNDGFSNGLTAPNPQAQEDMLRVAYARAGIGPDEIDYIETHGTGTLLGDPIEANAIGRVLGVARTGGRPLRIGSVKTNIGHLEAAAGMAGLIKVALATHRGILPRSLHFETPNPNIDFDGLHLAVQSESTPWPVEDRPGIAGVSSFGFGGTNCHVVVQQRPRSASELLTLSAADPERLKELAARMRDYVSNAGSSLPLPDLCRAAARHLSGGPARVAITARRAAEIPGLIDAALSGTQTPGVAVNAAGTAPSTQLVWILSAHGGQWAGMGRQLFEREPVFREAFKNCAAAITREAGWDLLDELFADESRSRLGEMAIAQPAIFSVQTALAALWRSWGIEPDAVIGHSMGEVSAVHVAGVLSLADAVKVICQRSRLLARTSGKGALAVVGLSADATEQRLAGRGDRLWVVAFNSPVSTLVSGEPEELAALLADLERDNVFCRRVRVDVAPHSPHVDPLLEELAEAVKDIAPRASSVRVCSTVEGRVIDAREFGPAYWVRNLRRSVLFAQGIDDLLRAGPTTFMELGPHPVLAPAVEQCLADRAAAGRVIETLRRGEDERAALLDAAGKLYAEGRSLDWIALAPHGRAMALPATFGAFTVAPAATPAAEPEPLTLTAHSREALNERIRSIADFLRDEPERPLQDVCYTLNVRRSALPHRFAAVARDVPQMLEALDAFAAGELRPGTSTGAREMSGTGRIAFVFPGQGSQWIGMGGRLMEREPVFREAIQQCHEAILKYSGFSLIEELTARDESCLGTIDVIQPALFAVQVALAALWRSWGIEPAAVVGHSMGEVAASFVAGALSLDDAARIICRRSRLLRRISGQGLMAVVELSRADADLALQGYEDRLSVAVSNSPRSTVISGDPAAVNEVVERLTASGIFCRHVKVDVASHSPQVDALRDDLLQALDGVSPREGTVPLYSTVTGNELSGAALDAGYWALNLRKPVLFSDAVSRLIADGVDTFIEASAHPLLIPAVQESLQDAGRPGVVVPSLRRDEDERAVLLGSLGALFTYGRDVDWRRLYPRGGRLIALPTFPWQRQRCWLEPAGESSAARGATPARAIDQCLYEISWKPEPLEAKTDGAAATACLVVADRGGVGTALADTLRERGDRVDVLEAEALQRNLDAVSRYDRIVLLGALDSPDAADLPAPALRDAAESVAMESVRLVQALASESGRKTPRLFVVTRGAQAVNGSPVTAPVQAIAWGIASVVAVEHSELRCTRIDLAPGSGPETAALLATEVRANHASDLVGYRNGSRYVARLSRGIAAVEASDVLADLAAICERRPDAVRAALGRRVSVSSRFDVKAPALPALDGTYLITGGLGALGLETAGWLVQRGARHLVLLGRRAPSDAARAAIASMEEAGATVRVRSADASSGEDMTAVLSEIAGSMPPLKGVFHAAGLLDDAVVMSLDGAKFRRVLSPKVQGAWNLHRLTLDAPLDFFVLYSSVLAYVGAAGQGNHAAANAVLDAIAQYRRSLGLPATSINWGAWAGIGLAAASANRGDRLASMGLASITPAEGREALERLIVADAVQGSVMRFDPQAWAKNIGAAANTLLADLATVADATEAAPGAEPPLAERLQEVPAGRARRELLESWLTRQVARILRLSASAIDINKPVRAMGLDSLMAVELRKRLEAGTGIPIPTTLVWNYPTVVQLAPEIAARLGIDLEVASAAPDAVSTEEEAADLDVLLGQIEALSDEDARRALGNGQTQVTDV